MRITEPSRGSTVAPGDAIIGIASSAGLSYAMTRPSGIPWIAFYKTAAGSNIIQKAIDDARASGKFVVVKFTANWCVNCHVIEETVFNSSTGVKLMNRSDVVAIKVDLSRGNEEGFEVLKRLSGGTGIPFSIFFRPGQEPVAFNSFFKVSDLKRALDPKAGPASMASAPPAAPKR